MSPKGQISRRDLLAGLIVLMSPVASSVGPPTRAGGGGPQVRPTVPMQYQAADVERLKKSVAPLLRLSIADLRELVPENAGIEWIDCPHCDGGARKYRIFEWQMGMGDTVRCRYCGMVFPNPQYPNNRERVIIAPSGARQVYRYYEDAKGEHHYFEAHAWVKRWDLLRDAPHRLASIYYHTGDLNYADRAAVILGRFAQVFPDYAVRFDDSSSNVVFFPADQKWPYAGLEPYRGGKWRWWGYETIPVEMALAYDLLQARSYDWGRVDEWLGKDVPGKIERDFIRLGYDFVAANPEMSSNKSPSMYADIIVAGRVLRDPAIVHDGLARLRRFMSSSFFFDGWWREGTPGYHRFVLTNLEAVARVASGYSDPPGWKDERVENLEVFRDSAIFARAQRVLEEALLPDGRRIPINDTWHHERVAPLSRSVPRLWAGLGHAVLGAGAGNGQFQAHVNWSGNYGHSHMDNGSLLLYAHGHELLSDLGYTHTRLRNWAINSASHNLVVVDQTSQVYGDEKRPATGNLLFFDASHGRVQVVDVDARPAYPQTRTYRRRLVHVRAGEGRDYLVDVFDVEGGRTHDYFLHGSADEPGALRTSLPLEEPVGSLVPSWGGRGTYTSENDKDLEGRRFHPYDLLSEILSGRAAGAWTATWRYAQSGLRSHFFPPPSTRVYRFNSPAIRPAGEEDNKLAQHPRRGIMQRREASVSRFVALHEPFGAEPWIGQVIREGDTVSVSYPTPEGQQVTDRVAFTDTGVQVQSSAGWEYRSGSPRRGLLERVVRSAGSYAFDLDQPPGPITFVRIEFGDRRMTGYRVKGVEGRRVLLEADPGFEYDRAAGRARFLYFPNEEFNGPVAYTIFR